MLYTLGNEIRNANRRRQNSKNHNANLHPDLDGRGFDKMGFALFVVHSGRRVFRNAGRDSFGEILNPKNFPLSNANSHNRRISWHASCESNCHAKRQIK